MKTAQPHTKAVKEAWIKFLVEKSETATKPFVHKEVIEEFRQCNPTSTKDPCLKKWFKEYRNTIRYLPNLDTKAMAKQLFAFNADISTPFLKKLRQDAHVEVFSHRSRSTMNKYVAKDGTLHLEGYPITAITARRENERKNQEENEEEEEEDTSDEELTAPPVPKRQKIRNSTGQRPCQMSALSSSDGATAREDIQIGANSTNTRRAIRLDQQLESSSSTLAPAFSRNQNALVVTSGALSNSKTPKNRNDHTEPGSRALNILNDVDGGVHENRDRQPIEQETNVHHPSSSRNAITHSEQIQIKVEGVNIEEDFKPQTDQVQQFVPEVPKPRTLLLATHKQLLKSIQTLIGVLGLPMDSKSLDPPIKSIERYEIYGSNGRPEFKKLEIDNLSYALHYSIMKIQQQAEVKPNNNAKSLRRYLDLLLFIISEIRVKELEKTQQQLKDAIGKIEAADKLIDVTAITTSLEVILDTLIPK